MTFPLKTFICILLIFLGNHFINATSVDSLKTALENASETERVDILNELYREYWNNEPVKAYEYTKEALNLAEKLNYKKGIAAAYNNLGVYYKKIGDFDNALDYYLRALAIEEELDNKERIAYALSNIGIIYTIKNKYNKALSSFKDALDIFTELGKNVSVARTLINIGNVFYDRGEDESALNYYLQARDTLQETDRNANTFELLTNIGNIYNRRKNYNQALNYYFQSLEIERANKNKFGQAHSLFNIGETYRNQGSMVMASTYLLQAAELAKQLNDKPLLSQIYSSMAEVYFAQEEYVLAYATLKRQRQIKDSLFNQETSEKLAELEALYELEKKEKENQLLQQQNKNKNLQIRNAQLITFAFVFVFLFLITVGVLIYFRFIQSNRAKGILKKRNLEISNQKQIINDNIQHMAENLHYAKSVQDAILNEGNFKKNFPKSFVFFKSKDEVSGDFYWHTHLNGADIVAVIDCTGHGLAGAFMTIYGNALLNQIVNIEKETDPAKILHALDKKIRENFKRKELSDSNHGMDAAICKIDQQQKMVTFSGANRPLVFIKDHSLHEIQGEKVTVANNFQGKKIFIDHSVPYAKGDIFYLFTDGFTEQFDEGKNTKYDYDKLKMFLEKHHQDTMDNQHERLKMEVKNWRGTTEQTDDILIAGIKL